MGISWDGWDCVCVLYLLLGLFLSMSMGLSCVRHAMGSFDTINGALEYLSRVSSRGSLSHHNNNQQQEH
jgi:hypothetical protein